METYTNIDGLDCVTWTDAQGTHSMTEKAYEALQMELSAEVVLPGE